MRKLKGEPLMDFLISNRDFRRGCRRVAKRHGFTQEEAEDFLQDLAVKVIEVGEESYDGRALPKTYLSRMYRNLRIDTKRKEGKYTHFSLIEMSEAPHEPNPIQSLIFEAQVSNKPSPLEILAERERIYDAIEKLPISVKKIVNLRITGMQYKEIASTLGIPESTAISRINRYKKRFAKLLD